ncbi:WGR domain-containing protein [Terrimonas sp. NA20]|uniref:WGR domain-containing protein n=1 Tax=Terrimonas ginsenosidimutans TaxID=2908004 RepID=A0ABS9KT02_9BACT|nr:WGR domain-containing protein [Terrimonas ginsenosidimutans]MCG2615431.1 WGR domain-containing protein [Terrimonas ginsenosidimutans]
MRLIRQSILFFQEGNSDKVYETDLCDVGNDRYVVNFRYGRRGASLKEGSKTPVPVSLQEAEKIYNDVVNEKTAKGYTGAPGVAGKPLDDNFLSAISLPSVNISVLPEGKKKTILQRLDSAANSTRSSRNYRWKLSRVIWKAGEYKINEAVPYLVKLFTKGDLLHQYCCTWSLVRCAGAETIPVLQAIYDHHPSLLIKRLALAGLLQQHTGEAKEELVAQIARSLPQAIRDAFLQNNRRSLNSLCLQLFPEHTNPNWHEQLYLLSTSVTWIRPAVKSMLLQLPLAPGTFNEIRAVYKLAEMLDDFEISGLLTCRFEIEPEFFSSKLATKNLNRKVYINAIQDHINPNKELKQKNTRLAYSQKTRWYLHKRIDRRLRMFAENNSTDYVRLATGILVSYKRERDTKEAFTTSSYQWQNGRYQDVERRFPANARAIFLHQLLNGNNPQMILTRHHIWEFISPAGQTRRPSATNSGNTGSGGIGGFIKKITGLFGSKKQAAPPPTAHVAPLPALQPNSFAPQQHLWDQLPQAYLQLLIEAEMDEVLKFAAKQLAGHPSFKEIKEKLDTDTLIKLIRSKFTIPADLGYRIILERFSKETASAELITGMLGSVSSDARSKAKEWAEANTQVLLSDAGFISGLLFTPFADIRSWGKELIRNNTLSSALKQAVTGRVIAEMMNTDPQLADNSLLNDVSDSLFALFDHELRQVDVNIVSDLLHHPASPVLLFGLRMVKHKKSGWRGEELKTSGLPGLLNHTYEPVRQQIVELINNLPDEELSYLKEDLVDAALSAWPDVRSGSKAALVRLANREPAFGIMATETLMPFLSRKELHEGIHEYLAELLSNELSTYLKNVDKQTALNLLYGNYAPAQKLGVAILENHIDPATLSLPQIIALGNHENITVRNWTWNFYKQYAGRIKYEAAAAIRILESRWEDTRSFAMDYFRQEFEEKDWEPEVLIGMADSVKPAVESFGRELITKYFTDANGPQYLLKLSQHPGEKMQLFTTNYMERFASGDLERIKELEFYFRSVLSRVNKNRIAKDRIFLFLLNEGLRSEEAANTVAAIISDISAQTAIGDKAKCIDLLMQLRAIYDIETPLRVRPVEERR